MQRRWFATPWAWIILGVVVLCCDACQAGLWNSHLAVSADGKWIACASRDAGTVTIIDGESQRAVHELAVGDKPEGVTFLGSTDLAAVAVHGADEVCFFRASTGKIAFRVPVFDEPYGVVASPDGAAVYVSLEYPGQVVRIDPQRREVVQTFQVGPVPASRASPDPDRRVDDLQSRGPTRSHQPIVVERGSRPGRVLEIAAL